jgi:predicted amidohydrolase YtcJ
MKLLFTNAKVHSLDESDTIHEAVSIEEDTITSVGSSEALSKEFPEYRKIDLSGADIYPGFVDAHAHIYGMGERLTKPRLEGLSQEQIYRKLNSSPSQNWIVSRGWDHTLWSSRDFPTRHDLDRNVNATQPIALTRVDGHALWCNSRALEIASIDRNTPDPLGGAILRDDTGEATGILIDEAMKLVESKISPATQEDLVRTLRAGADHFAKLGHVAVHEMGVTRELWEAYETLYRDHGEELPHAWVFLDMTKPTGKALFLDVVKSGEKLGSGRLHFAGIKLYLDGALGSRGANLLEDYSDDPGNQGLALMEDGEVVELMQFATERGLQIAVHAIGDRANARALDLFSKMRRSKDSIFRVEHAQIVREHDLSRFRELDVYALVQPAFFQSDRRWAEERLGNRMRTAYRWKSFLDAGVKFVASSDAPIEDPNPLEGIELLRTRDGVNDGEALDGTLAVRAYGQTAHELTGDQHHAGMLAPGYRADLTIVKNRGVLATIIDGKPIYSKDSLL